ncbi:hypothetical protein Val02_04200 [Virgisporangium aliadipatigenens]|uniref:DUF1684 domain-containing protein n=1 Tax=Virgisporangium aliadipatigenens TaxID=741659 RepID=A0A8J3YEB1_9ACTN|nr:DUF1684 domain-containing protein [Virgisporangium aliadipatigenens]GIJ43534.1 hypothetical protein Val02_04200 [Virgisporangium aliadipatigenens]
MSTQQWNDWHEAHERRRADKHGFLAVTGLYWLGPDPQRIPDAPGTWTTGPDGVVVELDGGESLVVDGTTVTGRYAFGPIEERKEIKAGWGDAVIEVARRGGYDIVRPRHPDSPILKKYNGTPAYAPSDAWVLDGRFVPSDPPRQVTVGAAVEGLEHVYESPGRVEFEVNGTPLALTVFNGIAAGTFQALFTDETSGVTTYAANRNLNIGPPDADGHVVLDFNRATNLPCAYTEFATCPLPPAENRLPIAVEAGEQYPPNP